MTKSEEADEYYGINPLLFKNLQSLELPRAKPVPEPNPNISLREEPKEKEEPEQSQSILLPPSAPPDSNSRKQITAISAAESETKSKSKQTKLRSRSAPKSTTRRGAIKRPRLETKQEEERNSPDSDSEPRKYNLRSKKPDDKTNSVNNPSESSKEIVLRTTSSTPTVTTKRKVLVAVNKWILKKSKYSFHDIILSTINTATYHQLHIASSNLRKIIHLTDRTVKSQLQSFVYQSKTLVALTWLTAVRIFEYNSDHNSFNEVKRIPNRYVSLSPNLITAMHYTDSKFYIARLEGDKENKPFIEVRDIFGNLLDGPIHYDSAIQSIYSDDKYLYIKTSNDQIHIHRKNLFKIAYYPVCYSSFTSGPLIASWVEDSNSQSNTNLTLLSATTKELIVSKYNIFSHKIFQCYRFEGNYKIVSIDKLDSLIIIHRDILDENSQFKSKIELGFLGLTMTGLRKMFIHEMTISLTSKIIEVKVHRDRLYLLGSRKDSLTESNYFQIGCIYLPNLKPMWVTNVRASVNSHILPHDDYIAIIKERQQLSSTKVKIDKKLGECKNCKLRFISQTDKTIHDKRKETIFAKILMHKNEYLEAIGTSIFKVVSVKDS